MKIISELNDSQKLAVLCAQLSDDKLANYIVVLDLNELESAPANFFVLCSCESTAQVSAVSDLILENAKNYRLVKPRLEGNELNEWVVIDFFDVVVHIMIKEIRDFYKIEKLWSDAKFFTVNNDAYLVEADYNDYIPTDL